ncbi:hypothetical protein IG631_04893 [Alternaria alternata]|nr:hypothetical protein IG631_04893 [Alternaria alternata]
MMPTTGFQPFPASRTPFCHAQQPPFPKTDRDLRIITATTPSTTLLSDYRAGPISRSIPSQTLPPSSRPRALKVPSQVHGHHLV